MAYSMMETPLFTLSIKHRVMFSNPDQTGTRYQGRAGFVLSTVFEGTRRSNRVFITKRLKLSDPNQISVHPSATGVCNRFIRTVSCPYGDSCKYIHPNQNRNMQGLTVANVETQLPSFSMSRPLERSSLPGKFFKNSFGLFDIRRHVGKSTTVVEASTRRRISISTICGLGIDHSYITVRSFYISHDS
ncbi:hypothetical protein R6Q57_005844 [Mikania cordata]